MEDHSLLAITEPMLRVRRALIAEFERLDRLCRQLSRQDPVCHRLITVPGVGTVVALTYRTGIDAPERLSRSRDVGTHFGLTLGATAPGRLITMATSAAAETRWYAPHFIKRQTS